MAKAIARPARPRIRFCLTCCQSEAAHLRDDIGTCEAFLEPTRAAITRRLYVMAVDALSSAGRPIRSRPDAQVLMAAAHFLAEDPRAKGRKDPPLMADDLLLDLAERTIRAQREIDSILSRAQQTTELASDGSYRVRCSSCGRSVSNPLPVAVIIRASVTCPECLERAPAAGAGPTDGA